VPHHVQLSLSPPTHPQHRMYTVLLAIWSQYVCNNKIQKYNKILINDHNRQDGL